AVPHRRSREGERFALVCELCQGDAVGHLQAGRVPDDDLCGRAVEVVGLLGREVLKLASVLAKGRHAAPQEADLTVFFQAAASGQRIAGDGGAELTGDEQQATSIGSRAEGAPWDLHGGVFELEGARVVQPIGDQHVALVLGLPEDLSGERVEGSLTAAASGASGASGASSASRRASGSVAGATGCPRATGVAIRVVAIVVATSR